MLLFLFPFAILAISIATAIQANKIQALAGQAVRQWSWIATG
jgi:hypothetical protein